MADKTKVTRIKASDDTAPAKKPVKAKNSAKSKDKLITKADQAVINANSSAEKKRNVFVRIGGYFKGAWLELKQVRWPTRKATWGLTLAVILFSAFFVVLILLLDTFFKYIFQLIIA